MVQVSKVEVNKKVQEMMWSRLISLVEKKHRKEEAEVVLLGLMTEIERLVVVKRLMAGILLLSGWDATSISQVLKLSRASIVKYKGMLSLDEEYRQLLRSIFPEKVKYEKKVIKEKGANKYLLAVLEELGAILDDAMVGRVKRSRLMYGDWSRH